VCDLIERGGAVTITGVNKRVLVFYLVLAGGLAFGAETSFFPIKDVRPGLKGKGRTCLSGTQPVEFEAEVLDVLPNMLPKQDVILMKLSGAGLEKTGLIAGMSGSPIYVDGRLLGAVAYGWAFLREPICGVTPFERMVELDQATPAPLATAGAATLEGLINRLSQPTGLQPEQGIQRLAIPLSISGASPPVRQLAERLLEPMGFQASGTGGRPEAVDVELEPGSPVALQLVTGDIEVAGVGTVTHIAGDRVYAMGHPIFGWGKTEIPMATARVHAVIPSQVFAFKLASSVKSVGTFTRDAGAGILGEVGRLPALIPVSVDVLGKSYRFQVVNHPNLTPAAIAISLMEALFHDGTPGEDTTITGTIKLKTQEPRTKKEATLEFPVTVPLQSGDPGELMSAAMDILFAVGTLYSNPIERIEPREVSVALAWRRGARIMSIDRLQIAKTQYEPGEAVPIKVILRPYRGEPVERLLSVTIPKGFPEGMARLVVCDSRTSIMMDRQEKPHLSDPRSPTELLELLQEMAVRDQIVVRASAAVPGLAIDGIDFERLPQSVMSVMSSKSLAGLSASQTRLKSSFRTDSVVLGRQQLEIEIKRAKERNPWQSEQH